LGERKEQEGFHLYCVAFYGLGSFYEWEEKRGFLQQGVASHTLSHSAAGTGMISRLKFMPTKNYHELMIYTNNA
jgi:hypothetical protein